MISFELFDEIIKGIQEQDETDENASKAMEELCSSWVTINSNNKIYAVLFKLVEEVMGDKDDWISWWLYENVKKEVTLKNKKVIDLSTTKALYDFLCEDQKVHGCAKCNCASKKKK